MFGKDGKENRAKSQGSFMISEGLFSYLVVKRITSANGLFRDICCLVLLICPVLRQLNNLEYVQEF